MEIANPLLFNLYDGVMSWAGTLNDVRLYPFGVDPLTVGDHDTPAGRCEGQQSHDHPDHPFAAYLPPMRDETEALSRRTVRVDLYPTVAYDVA